jgi:hypothetical protein
LKFVCFLQEPAEITQSSLYLDIGGQIGVAGPLSIYTDGTSVHNASASSQQLVLEQIEHLPSHPAEQFWLSRTLGGSSIVEGVLVVSVGPTTIVLDLHPHPLPADHLLTLVQYNLYRACAANAHILGLDPRSMHDDIISPFCKPEGIHRLLPESLMPTETQVGVRHHPYIDLFPFRSLRDQLILLEGCIDEDELCADLGGKNSGTEHTGLIVWSDPWDPMGWELSEYVATKWARVFGGCEEILMATDYWRRQRGEVSLSHALFRAQ